MCTCHGAILAGGAAAKEERKEEREGRCTDEGLGRGVGCKACQDSEMVTPTRDYQPPNQPANQPVSQPPSQPDS
ncbi:hypothetical protein E2C01_030751 [Portunus trituberculatus]|uniref:Uncharacterized protein n=1 Tax=Portunus trituberculatus TaxID=210409 RepID=A0A5B7EVP7_PORTR|nr:hypothetical protein [Portunus trituberculatus]